MKKIIIIALSLISITAYSQQIIKPHQLGTGPLTIDNVNNRIGINTSLPSTQLHVVGSGLFSSNLTVNGTTLLANNYNFDIDQTVGASQDNYILTYDNADGQISLEPAGSSIDFVFSDANRITILDQTYKSQGLQAGTNSIVIGSSVGTSGANNTFLGRGIAPSSTTANNNVIIGNSAATSITTASSNVAIGASSTLANHGLQVVIGYNTTSTGTQNVVIGPNAFTGFNDNSSVVIGSAASARTSSVVIGQNAVANQDGVVVIGKDADGRGGEDNVVIGRNANAANNGSRVVVVGSNAIGDGNRNTIIGYNATSTHNDAVVIGESAVSQGTNTIMLGNSSVVGLYCYDTSISSPSDARDKTNVETLQDGLDFVNTLRPVAFQWLMREGTKQGINDVGFIAQELYQSQYNAYHKDYLDLADYNPDIDTWFAQYANLIPVYAKAIQDLDDKIETQQQEINNLHTIIQQLTTRLETLENK